MKKRCNLSWEKTLTLRLLQFSLAMLSVLNFSACSQIPATHPPETPFANLSAVWAQEGGNKVTQDELRFKRHPDYTLSSLWDGKKIRLKGAQNEVINFNLILEAANGTSTEVRVDFNSLRHTSGSEIKTQFSHRAKGDPVTTFTHPGIYAGDESLFDWTQRPIEVFYVRYLQIQGLSHLSYETYDERHIPHRLRRPFEGNKDVQGTWEDRPDHDKFYPDIAVPVEMVPTFSVAKDHNQGIWTDIYIPKPSAPGLYHGFFDIFEKEQRTFHIPIELEVYNFALPDTPSVKTMAYLGETSDASRRYLGKPWAENQNDEVQLAKIRNKHFLMAHRHKISLIDSDNAAVVDQPSPEWEARLNGTLFQATQGYDGPGVGVSNDVYSIGTYGHWDWQSEDEQGMWNHTNAWEKWFQEKAPHVEHFLYLADEPVDLELPSRWIQWMKRNPGIGSQLPSFVTAPFILANEKLKDLNISATGYTSGITTIWEKTLTEFLNPTVSSNGTIPYRRVFLYNGQRPYQGSFCIEDEGVALRELPWAQFKHSVSRWFYWQSTYYNDFQGERGDTNVFETAQTFGSHTEKDPVVGETGWNYTNGDGVLFYPGTDLVFPQNSYQLKGPIASLRLKFWRRGIQDTDYLALAKKINPEATQKIIQSMVPKALWEYNAADESATFTHADISWPTDEKIWEEARLQLAKIIQSKSVLEGEETPE